MNDSDLICECPKGWCYHRANCRKKLPRQSSIRYPSKGLPILGRPDPPPRPKTLASRYDEALEQGGNLDEIAAWLDVTAAALRKHIKERKALGWTWETSEWKNLDNKYAHRRRRVIAGGRLIRPS